VPGCDGGTGDQGRGRTLGGGGQSFDEIFARYQGPIYRYILGMVGDVEQAQDLAQDTFVKVYGALPRSGYVALPAWLYRIAARTALDALRRRRLVRWLPLREGDDEPCGAGEVNLPTRCAAREGIAHALARLSPTQRACLLLRARDGLSIDEIADILRLSPGNVKVTLSRAKARFRRAYDAAH